MNFSTVVKQGYYITLISKQNDRKLIQKNHFSPSVSIVSHNAEYVICMQYATNSIM